MPNNDAIGTTHMPGHGECYPSQGRTFASLMSHFSVRPLRSPEKTQCVAVVFAPVTHHRDVGIQAIKGTGTKAQQNYSCKNERKNKRNDTS